MRLFVGAEISQTLIAGATLLVNELQTRIAATAPRARVTWVTPERLHITVRFIGEVDDRRGHRFVDILELPLDTAPFDILLQGAGAFPPRGMPRALWVGVAGGADRLREVEREVSGRLSSCGVRSEGRDYQPHLTLARVRVADGLMTTRLFDGLTAARLGTSRVDAITLFQSRLSPRGPTYLPLVRTRLAGNASETTPGAARNIG